MQEEATVGLSDALSALGTGVMWVVQNFVMAFYNFRYWYLQTRVLMGVRQDFRGFCKHGRPHFCMGWPDHGPSTSIDCDHAKDFHTAGHHSERRCAIAI